MNRSHEYKILALVSLLAIFSGDTIAGVTIYPIATKLDSHGNAQINVFTNADKTEFVKTLIKKINNPGTAQENEVVVNSTAGKGLMVAPAKFALSPGATRVIRLVNMQPVQTETLYRVYFESVNSLDQNAGQSEKQANLGVNMIWGLLVSVPPAQPKIEFTYNPVNFQLANTGNIHIKVSSIGICPEVNTDAGCTWSKEVKKAIYPGQQRALPAEIFNGKKYAAVRIKYTNWVDNTSGEKEFLK
ncbi:pilus assembly protein PapD [Enterobacter sp. ENT03]|uniref:pilus assembly protein PapD n=1 Tax=Enterobacter sp. ENT03 TaxID=2854780 RepID=UPI001C48AC51|nr:pilus assembly protein PapD [Enterobacter sp. ENT03]MBV7405512.1 pilus assembly protein PapD [Enterobacter sp. ENT03]